MYLMGRWFCGAQPLYMHEFKISRFGAAIAIMVFTFSGSYAHAAAMTIETSGLTTMQDYLKDRKIAFGVFDVASLLDTQKANTNADVAGVIRLANDPQMKERIQKATLIDDYFHERGMPLEGYGMKMVLEAEKNNLDWRLLPAIALRESSGGKHACDQNPFGWASCKDDFESFDDAIETVAWNLGGNNPNTDQYYSGDTRKKLFHYNGSVIRRYPDQVLRIMEKIAG